MGCVNKYFSLEDESARRTATPALLGASLVLLLPHRGRQRALAPLAMRLHPPSLASISLSIIWGVNDHPSAKPTGVEGESERAFGVTGF